jgi:hypothetical protein
MKKTGVDKQPKKKEAKPPSIRELKKKLWTIFSKYIRKRDGYVCYTCNNPGNNAGHYVPQSKGNALRYDERNVHCQCSGCNMYKRGNLAPYALRLEKEYGPGILQEFDKIKNTIYKPTHHELLKKIEHYKDELRIMEACDLADKTF